MKAAIWLVLFLLLGVLVQATPYYADVTFTVEETGAVDVTGVSNYPPFAIEQEYVSFDDGYYLFNFTEAQIFSDFVFTLHLPKDAVINYIRTPQFNRIEDTEDGITLIGSARNRSVELLVQYSFPEKKTSFAWWWLGLMLLGVLLYMFGKKRALPNTRTNTYLGLTTRQRQLVELLQSGSKTQAELEKTTGMPKSSLSRNIAALERKGIIEKHDHGMTNKIFLKNS